MSTSFSLSPFQVALLGKLAYFEPARPALIPVDARVSFTRAGKTVYGTVAVSYRGPTEDYLRVELDDGSREFGFARLFRDLLVLDRECASCRESLHPADDSLCRYCAQDARADLDRDAAEDREEA